MTPDEWDNADHRKWRQEFDEKVAHKVGKLAGPSSFEGTDVETSTYAVYEDDDDGKVDPGADKKPKPEENDSYLGAEVLLPCGDKVKSGKVRRRKRGNQEELCGIQNANPILDSCMRLCSRMESVLSILLISENMCAQCDSEGNQHLLMDCITDHVKSDQAIKRADMFVTVCRHRHVRRSTVVWKLYVLWKDGTTSWEHLSDLKESNPVEAVEYVFAHSIDQEPAFVW